MTTNVEPDTKQRLLDAAIKIFGSKGFIASTVREICQEADVNVAAVNYHFGDKEQLYATVLRSIFQTYGNMRDPELSKIAKSGAPAEERLRAHIHAAVLQSYDRDCDSCSKCEGKCKDECAPYSIFLMEMAHPTACLDEIVQTYIKPDSIQLTDILRDYLGPNAGDRLINQCACSIWGQILHKAMCWPIDVRLNGSDTMEDFDARALAEHIFQFTIGGLRNIKNQLDNPSE